MTTPNDPSSVTPNPSIHNDTASSGGGGTNVPGQLSGLFAQLPLQIISMIVNAILGLIGDIPFIGPIAEEFLKPLVNIFGNLFGLVGITDPSNLTSDPSSNPLSGILGPLENIPILGPVISIVDGFLGGLFPSSNVSVSAIGSQSTTGNMIINGSFNSANSVAANSDWTFDPNVDHTGTQGSGSAKTTADGDTKLLLSNSISVSSGQTVDASGWAQWAGLTFPPGNPPIWLGLQTYDASGTVVSNLVLQDATGGANSSWIKLEGSYTVPDGIAAVAVSLNVGSSITAGTVWFDDMSAVISGSPLVSSITGTSGSDNSGGPLGFLSGFFDDLKNMLGGLPGLGSPGSSQPTGGTGTGSDAGGTANNTTFDTQKGLTALLNKLIPYGGLTSNTQVPAFMLSALTPGTNNNVLPDPRFSSPATGSKALTTIEGQGLWVNDWPSTFAADNPSSVATTETINGVTVPTGVALPVIGSGQAVWGSAPGSVRTRRPGTITIFWVDGTWEISPGLTSFLVVATGGPNDPASDPKDFLTWNTSDWMVDPTLGAVPLPNTNLLDWEHFEFIKVNYPAAMVPMGGSANEGVQALISMINSIPGKFILMGHSQGGLVISNVLDELRYGTLQHRYKDLLGGFAFGNMRREIGRGFPNPYTGEPLVYAPDGYGISVPTLKDTPDLWWEWGLPKGTYPGHGDPEGIVFTYGDDISTLGTGPTADAERGIIAGVMAMKDGDDGFLTLLGELWNLLTSPGAAGIENSLSPTAPHNTSHYEVQPFLQYHDTRTYWQIVFDYINSLADQVTPPTIGVRHQLLGVPVSVQPEQVITAGAWAEWMNVVASGPQILVGVNAYDASGNLIAFITAESATVTDPESVSGWVQLQADFVMPPGAATACIVLDVEPEAMTFGTVWFTQPVFEPSGLIDSALLANIENIPQIPGQNIRGPQGIADMLTAYQNILDGLGTANANGNLSNVQLADMFQSQGTTAVAAAQALELAIESHTKLTNTSNQPVFNGLQPTGEVTFSLASIPAGSTLPSVNLSAGSSIIGFINCGQAVTKGFVEFLAEGAGGSGVYLNIYKVDPSSGDLSLLWASSDISGSVPNGSWGWVSATLPGNEEIPVTIGEIVALEIVAQDSAISVAAQQLAVPDHPSSVPKNLGASRVTSSSGGVSPSAVSVSKLTFSGAFSAGVVEVPFISFGISNVPPTYEPPNQVVFTSHGTFTYPIPSWVQSGDFIDRVALGAGGGGDVGSTFLIFANPGAGGAPGEWASDTLVYGTDIPVGTTELTVMVGAGGAAGDSPTAGGKSWISGTGVKTLTAAGGAAGGSSVASGGGEGPGNTTYQGRTYFGGPNVASASPGSYPGGGGGGGINAGAPGADGEVWITARQAS